MAIYDIGDVVRISSEFTQATVALDPTTVLLKVKLPDGTSVAYTYALAEVTKDSTGHYHRDVAITLAGVYRYRWTSTGTGQASEEQWFDVRPRKVA